MSAFARSLPLGRCQARARGPGGQRPPGRNLGPQARPFSLGGLPAAGSESDSEPGCIRVAESGPLPVAGATECRRAARAGPAWLAQAGTGTGRLPLSVPPKC
jgi:hypothetical protein